MKTAHYKLRLKKVGRKNSIKGSGYTVSQWIPERMNAAGSLFGGCLSHELLCQVFDDVTQFQTPLDSLRWIGNTIFMLDAHRVGSGEFVRSRPDTF